MLALMKALLDYLNNLSPAEQKAFAKRCKTSIGYLRKAASLKQGIGPSICIAIERETSGKVRCEQVRPDVDWAYIRDTRKYATRASA
jgi:DNA-binding transcriptional regulator YdaS (Cro superfamily)